MPYPSQAKMKFLTHRAGEAPLVVRNQQQLSQKENHWRDGRNLAEGTKAGTQDRYRAEPLEASSSRMQKPHTMCHQRNGWILIASHTLLRGITQSHVAPPGDGLTHLITPLPTENWVLLAGGLVPGPQFTTDTHMGQACGVACLSLQVNIGHVQPLCEA